MKDRLSAYFHWNDHQALEQAILVALAQHVDLTDVRRWSSAEGHDEKFAQFKKELRNRQPRHKRR